MSTVRESILAGKEFIINGNSTYTYRIELKEDMGVNRGHINKIYRSGTTGDKLFEDYECMLDKTTNTKIHGFNTILGEHVYVKIKISDIQLANEPSNTTVEMK